VEAAFAPVETRDALRILDIPPRRFRMWMDDGDFISAPPATRSNRLWGLDDLLSLAWFDVLAAKGMRRAEAGKLAAGLRAAMAADPKATEFRLYRLTSGQFTFAVAPPAGASPIDEPLPVARWRENVRAAVADYFARKRRSPDA
jgi:hypothetical protein